ncbi:MAG: FHA domain-containing protein, partial [Deltaproteobacteria bacterium]|nr:FHA domain-containing protein [Deltaproteobacteria bacterium]
MATCARCFDDDATAGVLCRSCASKIDTCSGLLPEHVVSRLGTGVDAWLVDAWGQTHPVLGGGTTIGRGTHSDLGILHESVSREHAKLSESGGSWTVRDLGSKNGTLVGLERVQGRAEVSDGTVVQVGKASLYFLADDRAMGSIPTKTLATATASRGALFRCALRSADGSRELQLVSVSADDDAPGVVL